ncbi:type IV secretion protein Dot [uncultured Legionella sp.]|uniref:type IV secretion protein Dot n=1 Tax=uncultured Legionella sp. TaxID=210934 RepID=UPI0026386617|nr:type IV secretion protein Dot [uncultured Legionella sp.]
MTFTPPQFLTLRADTLNLDEHYSIAIGRYKIIEPKNSSIPGHDSLNTLIVRTRCVIDGKSGRETSVEVFNLLSNECRDILKENIDEKMEQGTLILLGSLLHRYFRLIKKYDYDNSFVSYFFTPFDERNCKLFTSIRKALNLPDEMPKDYRAKDLQALDATTVVTALELFKAHMKLNNNYLKYPHFATDTNFEPYLDEIIKEHRVRGNTVLKQFKAINFIKSLVEQVEIVHNKEREALELWGAKLAKDHQNFSQLNLELIEGHLRKNMDEGPVKENILDLIYTPEIKDNIEALDHPQFLAALKKCSSDLASHTVVGGYGLLFQTKLLSENLTYCMEQALGLHHPFSKTKVFTDNDALNGLTFLKNFLSNNQGIELNCEFFGDRSQMNTLMFQYEKSLTKKTEPSAETNASLAF